MHRLAAWLACDQDGRELDLQAIELCQRAREGARCRFDQTRAILKDGKGMLMQLGVVDAFGQLLRFPDLLEVSFRCKRVVSRPGAQRLGNSGL